MIEKPKRKKDKKLLKGFHDKPCVVCARVPSDPDHIRTRGAGGHDSEANLWPLCRIHHVERHAIGLTLFCKRYYKAHLELLARGFFDSDLSS